jgi:AcrR family transcriptional regulator
MSDSDPRSGEQQRSREIASEPSGRAPIRRGENARQRVLRAALEVLAEKGLPGLTMEAVARRAGASKATLYRHWPSPAAMLVDAMDSMSQVLPVPATGGLRTDLLDLLGRLQAHVLTPPYPRLMAAFIDAAERDPALWDLHARLTERRREPVRHVLAEAIRRGDIPSDTDLEVVLDLLIGPTFYRRFVAHGTFPDDYAAEVVDHVLRAVGFGQEDRQD